MASPMAAANIGGSFVVGADRNRDGIPDALQSPHRGYGMQGPVSSYGQYGSGMTSGMPLTQGSYTSQYMVPGAYTAYSGYGGYGGYGAYGGYGTYGSSPAYSYGSYSYGRP